MWFFDISVRRVHTLQNRSHINHNSLLTARSDGVKIRLGFAKNGSATRWSIAWTLGLERVVSPRRLRWCWSRPSTPAGPGTAIGIGSARVDNRPVVSTTLQTLYDHQSHLCRPQRTSVARIGEMTAPAPSFICMQSLCKAAEAMAAAWVSRRGKNLESGRTFATRHICYLPGLQTAVEPRASRMFLNGPTRRTRNPPWSRGSSRRYLLELRQSCE